MRDNLFLCVDKAIEMRDNLFLCVDKAIEMRDNLFLCVDEAIEMRDNLFLCVDKAIEMRDNLFLCVDKAIEIFNKLTCRIIEENKIRFGTAGYFLWLRCTQPTTSDHVNMKYKTGPMVNHMGT